MYVWRSLLPAGRLWTLCGLEAGAAVLFTEILGGLQEPPFIMMSRLTHDFSTRGSTAQLGNTSFLNKRRLAGPHRLSSLSRRRRSLCTRWTEDECESGVCPARISPGKTPTDSQLRRDVLFAEAAKVACQCSPVQQVEEPTDRNGYVWWAGWSVCGAKPSTKTHSGRSGP